MKKRSPLILLLLFSTIAGTPAFAGPAIPTPTDVIQPDGSKLQVQIHGDEHQNWIELLPSGHTIIKNGRSGYWEYAERLPDGTLAPSGIRAEPEGKNAPASLPKGVQPDVKKELDQQLPQKREAPRAEE